MPNKINLPTPPVSISDNRELYSYLYRLVEQLNVLLGTMETKNNDDGK